jgi:hypothetical protein
MRDRRKAAADLIRRDRGIASPDGHAAKDDGAADPSPQTPPPQEGKPEPEKTSSVENPSSSPPEQSVTHLQAQMDAKQREVSAAEARVREAHTAAEKRAAQAEAKEAEVEKKLADLKAATAHPLEFMEKMGMSEAEFRTFLAAGGKFTAEQMRLREAEKSVRDLQARVEEMATQSKKERESMLEQMEQARFEGQLSNYTLVPLMGGMDAVRTRANLLSQQLGQKVSYAQAADSLEQEFDKGVGNLLKNEAVRKKFKIGTDSVESPTAGKAESKTTPRTLNSQMASSTTSESRKPHPSDMAARKELLRKQLRSGALLP